MREGMSTAVLEDDLERLKDWLRKQPHLPQDLDVEILTSFVHGTKTLEIAKQRLDSYLSVRSRNPKIFDFSVRDPLDPDFKKASLSGRKFFLPKTTPEGYRVLFHNLTPSFDDTFVHTQEIIRSIMLLELGMFLWPDMKGLIFVYDVSGVGASILTRMSPAALASGLQWFQGTFPVKLKGGIIFNAPAFMETIMEKLVKPFLNAKIFNRLLVTSEDAAQLKQMVPEEMLPSDYGGKEKSSEELNEYWNKMLEEKRSWFQKTSKQIVDDNKRPPDGFNTFGTEGTFRKLELD